MKPFLRSFIYHAFALLLITELIPGVSAQEGFKTIGIAALTLAIFNLLVRPIINLLLLPINLLTLGMFRWVVNVIILYILTIIVPEFKIGSFQFTGLHYNGLFLPPATVTSFWNTVLVSFFLSFILSFLYWLK